MTSQSESDLVRENAELREGLKFVQLERDNRTSAYEIGVKLIGELRANNARLREALNDLLGDCLESGDVPNQPFVKAPHHESITDAENAVAETPVASLEAICAEAKAEEREACIALLEKAAALNKRTIAIALLGVCVALKVNNRGFEGSDDWEEIEKDIWAPRIRARGDAGEAAK